MDKDDTLNKLSSSVLGGGSSGAAASAIGMGGGLGGGLGGKVAEYKLKHDIKEGVSDFFEGDKRETEVDDRADR
ncbi:hypothetical protein DICA3_D04456 [Diutina catenulata]